MRSHNPPSLQTRKISQQPHSPSHVLGNPRSQCCGEASQNPRHLHTSSQPLRYALHPANVWYSFGPATWHVPRGAPNHADVACSRGRGTYPGPGTVTGAAAVASLPRNGKNCATSRGAPPQPLGCFARAVITTRPAYLAHITHPLNSVSILAHLAHLVRLAHLGDLAQIACPLLAQTGRSRAAWKPRKLPGIYRVATNFHWIATRMSVGRCSRCSSTMRTASGRCSRCSCPMGVPQRRLAFRAMNTTGGARCSRFMIATFYLRSPYPHHFGMTTTPRSTL